MSAPTPTPLLEIDDLAVAFGRAAPVVDGVSLSLHRGQTLAIVGESGSGKSLTALSALRLLPAAGRIVRGAVRYRDDDADLELTGASDAVMRRTRGGRIAMVFQEPMTSLNPVLTIGEQVAEAARLHQSLGRRAAREAAVRALEEVGVPEAASRLDDYPHEYSGGMRQRVVIAIALACRPRVLLADEPTTALDAALRGQILDLIDEARRQRGLGVALITHDLGLIASRADAVCVMYAGRVVEYARAEAILRNPLHPYTRALLACSPRIDERRDRLVSVRDALGAPGAFEQVETDAGSRTPWWPGDKPCRLASVGNDRWIGVRAADSDAQPVPRIAPRVARAEAAA